MEGRYHHRSHHLDQLFSEAEQEASRGVSVAAACLRESHRDDHASSRTCFQFAKKKMSDLISMKIWTEGYMRSVCTVIARRGK